MTVDCKWIEKNLEALFCDGLDANDNRLAHEHIDSCTACRKEIQALNAIEPIIRKHFAGELAIAQRPRNLHPSRVFGLSAAALAVVAVLVLIVLRVPQPNNVRLPLQSPPQPKATAANQPVPPDKDSVTGEISRAKPEAAPDKLPEVRQVNPVVVPSNAPDFLIKDLAGYTHASDEYRGHVVVVGVWSPDQLESAMNIERLYKAFGTNPRLRFLGVANEPFAKPANTTFPVFYNQGSKLLGAQAGDFVVLDERGNLALRGSLTRDFENLRQILQTK